MGIRVTVWATLLAVALASLVQPAHAQTPANPAQAQAPAHAQTPANPAQAQAPDQATRTQAQERFRQAREAHLAGDYATAARLFEQAHRISPHASAQFNAAIAWDRADAPARAADAYEAALDLGGLTAAQAAAASDRLAALKETLGYLRILQPVGASVSVAHVENATLPTRLHVRPGRHRVAVRSPDDRRLTRTVRVLAGETNTLSLVLPPAAARSPTPSRIALQSKRPEGAPAPQDQSDTTKPTRSNARRTWGWVAMGTGVALSGVAVVLGLKALAARDDFESSGRRNASAHDKAANLRLWTNVTWGGAATMGGTGLILVLSSPKVEF